MAYAHVFGPVLSGRLGRSLGLDLLGTKICSLDCVYCEVGATRVLTCARGDYVPADRLLEELARWKAEGPGRDLPAPDHVTLGGSGEPCLNAGLGRIIDGAKALFPGTPVAVLTNSTLLPDPEVRRELARADVVLPSLDTLVPQEFLAVNRPHPDLTLDAVRQGLLGFRAGFSGRICLEVLLTRGMNDTPENRERLAAFIPALAPDRVDVVTLTRPGTQPTARAVDRETLTDWRRALCPGAGSGGLSGPGASPDLGPDLESDQGARGDLRFAELKDMIQASVGRRPQTTAQLAAALSVPVRLVARALDELTAQGRITARTDPGQGAGTFHGPAD